MTSHIVDVPTVRKHKLSSTSVTAQNYVLVRVRLANGVEGIGEAATLGGPRWSEESVEAMKANIDAYLAPAIIGQRADRFEAAGVRMDQAAKRNNAAKAAVETALFDAVGKTLGLPASALLGGAVRDRIPVLWTLASGDPAQEVEEARAKLDARLHRTFKVKIGAQAPEADMARMRHLARALEGRAELIVDANQAWDETVSIRCLPQLAEMGVRLVEQPVPAWNVGAMARLRARPGTPPLLADECVFDHHDMLAVASCGGRGRGLAQAGEARRAHRRAQGGGGGGGGRHRALRRLPAGKFGRRGGAPAGVRHLPRTGMGLRALRAADPDGRVCDASRCASRTSTSICRPDPASASCWMKTSCAITQGVEEPCCTMSAWMCARRTISTRSGSSG